MSHTYAHNPVHVVFSTKDRRRLIAGEMKPRLWAYIAGICKNHKIFVHQIGGMEDHLHMLIEIPLTITFSDALEDQDQFFSMDGPPIRLAAGFRPFRRKRIQPGRGNPLHPQPGKTPSENGLRG